VSVTQKCDMTDSCDICRKATNKYQQFLSFATSRRRRQSSSVHAQVPNTYSFHLALSFYPFLGIPGTTPTRPIHPFADAVELTTAAVVTAPASTTSLLMATSSSAQLPPEGLSLRQSARTTSHLETSPKLVLRDEFCCSL
jgi:hypothetical protein